MEMISVELLQDYLSKQSRVFTTSNGLTVGMLKDGIYSSYKFSYDDIGFECDLFTETENLSEFIEYYRLESLKQIQELDYRNIWTRYLNREANMQVTQSEMQEAPLTFRLHKTRTMVFSRELHFYDEVNSHLTLAVDFFEYFYQNENKLQVAMENMYRF